MWEFSSPFVTRVDVFWAKANAKLFVESVVIEILIENVIDRVDDDVSDHVMMMRLLKLQRLMSRVVVVKEKLHAICEENGPLLSPQHLWSVCDSSLDSCFCSYSCFCFDLSSCSSCSSFCLYCGFCSCSCSCSCFVSLTFCASCASRRHSKSPNHLTKKRRASCAFSSFSFSSPFWPSSS